MKKSFKLPVAMVVEEDIIERMSDYIKEYLPECVGKKAIFVSEEFLVGLYGKEVEMICASYNNAEQFNVGAADYETAVGLAKHISWTGIQVVIGFGGGRVLDVAKYASFVAKTTYVCIPTSLSNDSLASPVAVLTMEGMARKTLGCTIPAAIFVDTDIIANAPKGQTLSGIGDTISKHTALFDWQLATKAAGTHVDDFAYSISRMAYDTVYHCDKKDLKDPVFIRILCRSLVMGGLAMEISGDSRPSSGSEHLFAHSLEEFYPEIKISHGMATALGSVGACIFQGRDEKQLMKVCYEYGLDLNPANYGITKDIFADCWLRAASTRPDRYTILNTAELNRDWLDMIYDRMANQDMSMYELRG